MHSSIKKRSMSVCSVSNQKGGTGKTFTATHTAASLATRGYTVLFIDADGQGTATRAFGVAPRPALYDLLVRGANWQDCTTAIEPSVWYDDLDPAAQPGTGALVLLPSNHETRNIAHSITSVTEIKRRLDEVSSVFDFCIIDTSPTPSLLHGAIYLATDNMIVVSACEAWSLDGARETLAQTAAATDTRKMYGFPSLQVAAIVPNMYKAGRIVSDEALEWLRVNYPELTVEPIPDREVCRQAAAERQLVYIYEPTSDASEFLRRLSNDILTRCKHE